jgi:hypothetical protein
MTWLSDPALKRGFVVQKPVPEAILPSKEAAAMIAAPQVPTLFEAPDGLRIPTGRCEGDDAKVRRCERTWESGNLARGKGVASRKGATLTLAPKTGGKLDLTDWEKCSPEGECDGERFTYLGPLAHAGYHAVEIDYEHDSPSLALFDPSDGKVFAVHYGSEATLLDPAQSVLASAEDVNDATTLLLTRLGGGPAGIEVQCVGARTESASFGVTFKRWSTPSSLDVVLLKAGQTLAARLERGADGAWTLRTATPLKTEGFECRQR